MSAEELRRKVLAALTVYAARGRAAKAILAEPGVEDRSFASLRMTGRSFASLRMTDPLRMTSHQIEAFLEAMRLRDIAFNNFKALENLAAKVGYSLAGDSVAHALWAEIEPQNQELAALFKQATEQLQKDLLRLADARAFTAACHSGQKPSRLTKAI